MADPIERLAAALEEFIISVGRGVAQAQLDLDRSSIEIQKMIDLDPLLSQTGIQATWYRMPRTELEVKVAIAFADDPQPPPQPFPNALARAQRLFIQPVNARYQNQFRYDANAASTLHMTIVPVPPPTSGPPNLSEQDVRNIAAPLLQANPAAQVIVTFTPGRLWNVIQFTQSNGQTTTTAVVEVNDDTKQARKL